MSSVFPPDPPFSTRPHTPTTCLWRKTCCIRLRRRRGGGIRRSGWSRARTLISWMLNVQVAIRSPQCSAMLRQWCCVLDAPQCCANPLEEKHASQKDALSGESSINLSLTYLQRKRETKGKK